MATIHLDLGERRCGKVELFRVLMQWLGVGLQKYLGQLLYLVSHDEHYDAEPYSNESILQCAEAIWSF